MCKTYSRLPQIALFLFLCAMTLGCDATNDVAGPGPEQIKTLVSSLVESVTSIPVVGDSGEVAYLLKIQLRKNPNRVVLPEAINILSHVEGLENIAVYDDGTGVDETANDGVYTGIVPEACIDESGAPLHKTEKAGVSACTIEFVGPGERCGKFGICPSTAHRSFLWGLIEYDVDVVLCFCIIECDLF